MHNLAHDSERLNKLKKILNSENKNVKITKIILAVIAITGLITLVAIVPGLVLVAKPFLKNKKYSKRQFRNSITSLQRNGFLKKEKISNGWRLKLTSKGEKEVEVIILDDIKLEHSCTWDKKWRFVIFDIPSRFTKSRNEFRFKLEDLGFYKYQNSIWVTPYRCQNEIFDVARFFGVSKYIDILEVNNFGGEAELRKVFFK